MGRALVNKGFMAAMAALSIGGYAIRKSWIENFGRAENSPLIFRQVPSHIGMDIVPKMQSVPDLVKEVILSRGLDTLNYKHQIAKLYPHNTVVNYSPSVEDIEAEDWYVVYDEEKVTEEIAYLFES